jgi:hypothetical protein
MTPLSELMSRCLLAFTRDYDGEPATNRDRPPLVVWSNVLRVLDADGTDQREIPQLACVSTRVVRVAVDMLVRQRGWAVADPHPQLKSSRMVRLTPAGLRMQSAGRDRIQAVQIAWQRQLGQTAFDRLRTGLEALVHRLPLELPHYPTGYGQGDPRPTGGGYVAATAGPPRVPGHGEEWPVVPRRPDGVPAPPMPALLSQALTQFAIDYEQQGQGWFVPAAILLQYLDDDAPLPLGDVPADALVTGSGKSTLERHQIVVVERDPDSPRRKRVRITRRGRAMRDEYRPLATRIEQCWHDQFGSESMIDLRDSLEGVVAALDAHDLPAYPPVLTWLSRMAAG